MRVCLVLGLEPMGLALVEHIVVALSVLLPRRTEVKFALLWRSIRVE